LGFINTRASNENLQRLFLFKKNIIMAIESLKLRSVTTFSYLECTALDIREIPSVSLIISDGDSSDANFAFDSKKDIDELIKVLIDLRTQRYVQ
jgi:hypothetical protein